MQLGHIGECNLVLPNQCRLSFDDVRDFRTNDILILVRQRCDEAC